MILKVKTGDASTEKCDLLVVFEDYRARNALGASVKAALDAAGDKGAQTSLLIAPPPSLSCGLVAIIRPSKFETYPEDWTLRLAAAEIAKLAKERNAKTIAIIYEPSSYFDRLHQFADGLFTASYTFQDYRKEPQMFFEKLKVTIFVPQGFFAKAKEVLGRVSILESSVRLARDLVNHPPNLVTPAFLAAKLRQVAREAGAEFKSYDERQLEKAGFVGHVAVGGGSVHPPRMAVAHYRGGRGKNAVRLALVGKGLTFDSGGLSIKPWDGMWTMKGDMAGAAAVIAAFAAITKLGLPIDLTAIVCAAENMPDGSAYRPGDILTYKNGKSVEIISTDAEGRMVLADGLIHAGELGATHIVDVATLTGACVIALGTDYTGLFGNDAEFTNAVKLASKGTGELFWELPLPAWYRELLKDEYCDLKNAGGRWGGAITAAIFLKEFVEDGKSWCHLDIAPTFMVETPKREFLQAGGTGIPVRTLIHLAKHLSMKVK